MEVTGEQLNIIESELKRYLPQSLQVYGSVFLRNRVRSDPVRFIVDRWPDFNVIVCKPQYEERGDLFKDMQFFAKDEAVLEEILRKSSVVDWTQFICVGINFRQIKIFEAVAAEKKVPRSNLEICHMMVLEDVSNLPPIDSSEISLSSLDESHTHLVNQVWKFGRAEDSVKMIRNQLANFPSCCVLDAEGQPVSWILTYGTCAMGLLYTLPEHRGKGYAKVVVSTLAKRFHAQGYPIFCFIEEENERSYRLFKSLGFTEDPAHRESWFKFNNFYKPKKEEVL